MLNLRNTIRCQQNESSSLAEQKSGSTRRICVLMSGAGRRRFIIWTLLLIQILFVGFLWLLQLNANLKKSSPIEAKIMAANGISIIKPNQKAKQNANATYSMDHLEKDFIIQNFAEVYKNDIIMRDHKIKSVQLCFREGTERVTEKEIITWQVDDTSHIPAINKSTATAICHCHAQWHGQDCAQPEIIWRTLLAAKRKVATIPFLLQLHPTFKAELHRLVYMLSGNFFSLDLLELQIRAVAECVDYFLINITNRNMIADRFNSIRRRLKEILRSKKYFITNCRELMDDGAYNNTTTINTDVCSPLEAYNIYKNAIRNGPIVANKATDLFLHTNDAVILNRKALKYIKYYYNATERAPYGMALQFRLKYIVYGFYWQHPELTKISGVMSSFAALDNLGSGNGDPSLLKQMSSTLLIGDLNHFGGWYCSYCQQPTEIIETLLYAATTTQAENIKNVVQFPNSTKHRQIDVNYVQQLIAQGQHIADGKLQLLQLRRSTEKYYAPNYTAKYSWKFGNLLFNNYATTNGDDDVDNDDY